MTIDLKIGWNDLSKESRDKIKKLHKLGCKVNIIYPEIESTKDCDCGNEKVCSVKYSDSKNYYSAAYRDTITNYSPRNEEVISREQTGSTSDDMAPSAG